MFEKILKQDFLRKKSTFIKKPIWLRTRVKYRLTFIIIIDLALYKVDQFLYSSSNNTKKSLAIFLGVAKALDTVDHNILFSILPSFRINKCNLTWFKGYLTNRKQTVKINGVNGNVYEIKYEVPQS
jgi:hypothetical protein